MKHIPKKRFGQNFLIDPDIIRALVRAIRPMPNDLMVEIGPGLGALTKPLLQALDHLHVVELDRDVVAWMQGHYPADNITIHHIDALKFDFASLLPSAFHPGGIASQQERADETIQADRQPTHDAAHPARLRSERRLRVVGNLPYNISTPILFHLLDSVDHIIDMHFMLQKEVVERMVAQPSTPAYGRLSVMLQYRLDLESLVDVPPQSFDPQPKVDSAFVRATPWPSLPYPANDEALFARIVSAAFSQRRKTLRNTLKGTLNDAGFEAVGIDPQLRAENLGVADFVAIANYLGR